MDNRKKETANIVPSASLVLNLNRWNLRIILSLAALVLFTIILCVFRWPEADLKQYSRLVNKYKLLHDRTPFGAKAICSKEYFRDQLIKDRIFPSFDSCQWSNKTVDTFACFNKRGIRKISIIGDSNGLRFYRAMIQRIGKDVGKCKIIKVEERTSDNTPSKDYFCTKPECKVREFKEKENLKLLFTRGKSCQGCQCELSMCNYQSPWPLYVEYVTTQYTIDSALISDFSHQSYPEACSDYKDVCWPMRRSHTTQEYILKEYFADTGYPDLVLWFQNSHDKNFYTPDEIEIAAHHLLALMHLNAPRNTTFYVFNKVYEEVEKKPKQWKDRVWEGKYSTSEQLERLNKAIATGVRDFLTRKRNTNIYPFFDLYAYGKEHAEEWGQDGVHKKPVFYKLIIDYILREFCDNDLQP